MLTPGQIKGYQFQSAGEGLYRADEVDNFIQAVSAAYEKMYTENGSLIQRVNMLADKVKSYQEEEELIKKTLLVAQKKADEMESTSKKQSEELVSTAEKKAQATNAAAEQRAKDLLTAAEERARKRLSEASQQSADTLNGARVTAEKTLDTAKTKAMTILTEAKKRAEQILADAKAKQDAVLGSLQGEVEKERKALEVVRAQSREFKDKLTASYQEQLNMTGRLLGFVDTEDTVARQATQAAAEVQPAEQEDLQIAEETVDVDTSFLDAVDTAASDDDDLFASITVEDVISQAEETVAEEAAAEEPTQGFSFVEGFGSFGADPAQEVESEELQDVEMAGFDDIFQSALAHNEHAEPEEQPIAAEESMPLSKEAPDADPFHALRSKYSSVESVPADAESVKEPIEEPAEEPIQAQEEPELIFSGFASRVQQSFPDEEPLEEPAEEPVEETEEPDEEERRPVRAGKPEKKKHRLSLFARYEEDDEDDDEDEDDEDDEDDDEDEGGFKGFFRK